MDKSFLSFMSDIHAFSEYGCGIDSLFKSAKLVPLVVIALLSG
jgi:hypothetical protein